MLRAAAPRRAANSAWSFGKRGLELGSERSNRSVLERRRGLYRPAALFLHPAVTPSWQHGRVATPSRPPRHGRRGLLRAAQRVGVGVLVIGSAAVGGAVALAHRADDGGSDARAPLVLGQPSATLSAGADPVPEGASSAGPADAPTPAGDPAAQLPAGLTADDVAAGILTADVPTSGSGAFVAAPGTADAPGAGEVFTVSIEVEDNLPVDPEVFAVRVMAILNDPRGWGAKGAVTFARTDGAADIRVTLATGTTVDTLCAPVPTHGDYSCGRNGRASINYSRWVTATPEFGDDTATYRAYVINHEVGHLLGHAHQPCPAAGAVAPIMQQQTISVAPCLPNGWPYPDAG